MNRFEQRRRQFMAEIGDDIAVVPAARETIRNDDVHHPFRQGSDFFMLTGFDEPDAVALIDPGHDQPYVLFVRPRDPEQEAWNGLRAGVDGAITDHGADAAYPVDDLAKVLRDRVRGHDAVWYTMGSPIDATVLGVLGAARSYHLRTGEAVPTAIRDAGGPLSEMRVVKSEAEIDALREACRVSVQGHLAAIAAAAPDRSEHDVQVAMEHAWRSLGAVREGYPSIVASGDNACILHYVENDRILENGDLLLVDAAAEFDYASADITRTFPVNGTFTAPQRAVYELVLAAHQAVLAACAPGLPYSEMHQIAVRTLTAGMVDLGLVPGPVDDAIEYGWYRQFYFHGTGHWLGMDVHDAGAYKVDGAGRPLAAGMAFTVEPGLYVARDKAAIELFKEPYDTDAERDLAYVEGAKEAKRIIEERKAAAGSFTHDVPAEFLGIGVRIEDDILITADGMENLTGALPVDADEVEALAAGS